MSVTPVEAAIFVSNLCSQTHHSQLYRLSWQARSSLGMGLGTETVVLCADYWLAFPELSRLPEFLESPCAMLTSTGFHDRRRAHSTSFCWGMWVFALVAAYFLLPKEPRSSWSHGVWEQKKSNSICCKCKKCKRHNGEAWDDRNKNNEFLLSILRLDRIQIFKSLTVIFLGTHYNGKIKTKNPPTNAVIPNSILLLHFFKISKPFRSENCNFLLEV